MAKPLRSDNPAPQNIQFTHFGVLNDGKQSMFGAMIFHLSVSRAQFELAVTWAIVVALAGGILPSIRAARRPVVEALRAT